MSVKKLFAAGSIVAICLAITVGAIAFADSTKGSKPAGQPQFKLPPGWTEDDMKACILAGTPGKMHEQLAKGVGVWHGTNTMWMGSDSDPIKTECTSTVTTIMDGHYTKCEMAGEMPGMGPYNGLGICGFDNVSRQFVSIWIDNHGTGMMNAVGELSPDGKTTTWKFTYNCPITRKPAVMRQIETITGPNTKTLEMFGADPKSGKEYKMMSIELTRK